MKAVTPATDVVLSTHGHSVNDLLDLVDNPPAPARRFKSLCSSELKSRPDPEGLVEDVLQRDRPRMARTCDLPRCRGLLSVPRMAEASARGSRPGKPFTEPKADQAYFLVDHSCSIVMSPAMSTSCCSV